MRDRDKTILRTIGIIKEGKEITKVTAKDLIELLNEMSGSERRSLRSYLFVLILHLLKWDYQPEHRSSSWVGSILNSTREVQNILLESPSLRGVIYSYIKEIYPKAIKQAIIETNLSIKNFPNICPYSIDYLLSDKDYKIKKKGN